MQLVATDILGPLPESNAGNTSILVAARGLLYSMDGAICYTEPGSSHCGTEAGG